MIKEALQILDAIEKLKGPKFLSVGILPCDNRMYRVEADGLVTGDRLPLLYAITSAMDMGGHLLVQQPTCMRRFTPDGTKPVYNWYAVFLGDKNFRVCTKEEFERFFPRDGFYKEILT